MILTLINTEILTIPNILFIIGIFGTAFGVYSHFKKPTEDLEHKQIISEKDLGTKASLLAQKEVENKAILLAQQVEWEKIANEKRFSEVGLRLNEATLLAANHIHTVDVKVDKCIENITHMSTEITKLATVIEERIPRRNN